MLTALFAAARLAFTKLAAFVFAHWRIILPVLIVGLIAWSYFSMRGQRDDAIAQLYAYKQEQIQKAAERKLDNERKEQEAQLRINSIMANHQVTINQLRKEYGNLQSKNAAAVKSNADLRERLRLEVANRFDTRLPGLLQASGESAGSGGDSNATVARSAYDTLDLACSITTADYNALREAWDAGCKVHGCQ